MDEQKQSQPTIIDVLRVRPFFFLWLSQILSQVAFNMLNFVLMFRVYQLTSSNSAVAVLVLFFMLPQLLLSLVAGVLVDRLEKKFVMLVTNAARGICLLPLIFFVDNLGVFYVTALSIAIVTQFFLPAEVPMIPRLVGKKLLLPANALFTGTMYGSIIMGFILAGPALKFLGPTFTFFLIAAGFLGASICNSLLPGNAGREYVRNQMTQFLGVPYMQILRILFNDIGEMLFAIFRGRHLLFAVLFLTIAQAVIIVLGVLLPGYATTILALDVEDSSLILLAPAALGMILGSILVARIGHKFLKGRLVLAGVILTGVILSVLPLFSRLKNAPLDLLYTVGVLCFLLGVFNVMIIIPSNIIIQERSIASIRGRIYGLFNALSALTSIVPVAMAGYFSDVFGVGRVMTFIGSIIIVIGLIPLFGGKDKL